MTDTKSKADFLSAIATTLSERLGTEVAPACVEEALLSGALSCGHTPDAAWRFFGRPDPHGDRFDVERAALPGGNLTDDQVAFQTAMTMRDDLDFEGRLAVARDRIRWLSRKLAEACSTAGTG